MVFLEHVADVRGMFFCCPFSANYINLSQRKAQCRGGSGKECFNLFKGVRSYEQRGCDFRCASAPCFRVETPSETHVSLGYAFSFSSGDLYGNKSPRWDCKRFFGGYADCGVRTGECVVGSIAHLSALVRFDVMERIANHGRFIFRHQFPATQIFIHRAPEKGIKGCIGRPQ